MSQTVWVHGTAVQPAEANDVDAIERHGNGAKLIGIGHPLGKWFHFSIPAEVGNHLASVSLDAEMGDYYINKVHVYHGHYKLATFDNLNLSGDRVNKTFQIPKEPEINRGIGISIYITRGPDVENSATLCAAGATFS